MKLPHVNKKLLPRKRIFVQTPYSHSTLKLERKKSNHQNHSLFRFTYCFDVAKITTPIWLQNHENVWTDLKKNIARRIPETTRIVSSLKRHPFTHQTKRASTKLWLSWDKTNKTKVKTRISNQLKYVKLYLIKFSHKLTSRNKYLCTNT